MSRKHVLYSLPLMKDADATLTVDSIVVDVSQLDKTSIHIKHDVTSTGTFEVFVKNGDKDTFFALDFGEVLATDASGEVQILLNELPFTALYLAYTPTVGVGTFTAILTSKSLGA